MSAETLKHTLEAMEGPYVQRAMGLSGQEETEWSKTDVGRPRKRLSFVYHLSA